MFGRILISLISCVFCDLRARFAFFCASYLNLPTSRNLATGGSAFGDTSTRSSPSSAACSIASRVYITPRFSPSWSITRTFGLWIHSLKRGPFIGGAWFGRRIVGGRMGRLLSSLSGRSPPHHSAKRARREPITYREREPRPQALR